MRVVYQLLLWLGLPALLLRLEWRARREPEYGARIRERFGGVPRRVARGCVWFHAVSAGESIAVAPLVAQLVSEFSGEGGIPFLVTTTTPTGSVQVRSRLGDRVHHCYAPYDFPFAVRSFFDIVEPRLLVLVETELWPNTIAEAHRRGVPVLLINARLSKRSTQGYRRLGRLTRKMLKQVDTVVCQTSTHLDRFKTLGLSGEKGTVLGSVKFDAKLPDDHAERAAALRQALHLEHRRVWIAGSTHSGEDELLLNAHARIRERFPRASLLLVPRHPARAAAVGELALQCGFAVRLAGIRKPLANVPSQDAFDEEQLAPANVLVWRTLGQLQYLYGLSEIAFLGGSLVKAGGHNPIEAALCGQPLAMGPHIWNFDEVARAFEAADCLTPVQTAEQLADVVVAAFADEPARNAAGARAVRVVKENRGASERLLVLLRARIHAAIA